MLQDETATVLPFRDAAMRRPIHVAAGAAGMDVSGPLNSAPQDLPLNVVSLARFAGSRRHEHRGDSLDGRPEGGAA